jgi:protein-L-isoaspartate(D-aspartate) O-methyltransferase
MTSGRYSLAAARDVFVRELSAGIEGVDERLVEAFCAVRREDFLGPPPWKVYIPGSDPKTTSDPIDLYQDSLVALDDERMIVNGSPSLWLRVFAALTVTAGERVVHIGTGAGYYTAVLAELAGPTGSVLGIEIDPGLAEKARSNLRPWSQAQVRSADGTELQVEGADVIVVNSGVTIIEKRWLDGLNPGGRIYVPLTLDSSDRKPAFGFGAGFVVTKTSAGFGAHYVSPVAIIPCIGARTEASHRELQEALQARAKQIEDVRSLLQHPHERTSSCWCHVDGACLSSMP